MDDYSRQVLREEFWALLEAIDRLQGGVSEQVSSQLLLLGGGEVVPVAAHQGEQAAVWDWGLPPLLA